MNSNVRNRNDVLTPFASSCGFANSRNSTDDQENIVPNQTVQPTPLFAQNNTLDSDDYAGPSSSTLNTVPAVSTEDQMADAISNLVIAIFGGAAEVFERDRSLLEMGYGDPDDFVNRKPLLTDLQQLRGFNLLTHNFGIKAMHAVFSALGDPEPPSTSSAEHDDPDESY